MRSIRKGFTLIELLVVVVVIGILAAIAIPKFQQTKGKAYASSIKSDLKNLATMQESYFNSFDAYSSSLSQLGFASSNGVELVIVEATAGGWSASGTHAAASPLVCAVYFGTAAAVDPATTEGVIECR